MTTTTAPARQAVSAAWRRDILSFAASMVPEPERHHAGLILSTAAPLLEWAGRAAGEDDLRNRMRAMREQNANTPPLLQIAPDEPRRWIAVPALTPDEFLAEAAKLYAFIAAGRD